MNSKKSIIPAILITMFSLFGCGGNDQKEIGDTGLASSSAALGNETYYHIDTKTSTVKWKGGSLAGTNNHEGYVYLSRGQLKIQDGQFKGGSAQIDMNTIEDDKHSRRNGLIDHLKDPDFFDVRKFPVASIELVDSEAIKGSHKKVYANLTIKGIANPVIFPAEVVVKGGEVRMKGRLAIDRTKWDVRYKSGKFFDLLADETISDSIEFHVDIVARK